MTTTTTTPGPAVSRGVPRLELWVEARAGQPAINPVIAALLRQLAAEGRAVTVRVPELDPLGPVDSLDLGRRNRADLVLLKTATTLSLSLAIAAEAAGGLFLNAAAATSAANDKAAVLARLSCAGVPVPVSYLIDPDGRSANPAEVSGGANTEAGGGADGAWVSKPVLGWHGIGVRFHETMVDALAVNRTAVPQAGWLVDDGTRLVQRQVGGGEPDLKVYVAGEQIFAAAKAFSSASFSSDVVVAVALDRVQADIVRAAGQALGLRLFGVDLRLDAGTPVVIDINPFPGFRGFPAAVPALLAEIDRACLEIR